MVHVSLNTSLGRLAHCSRVLASGGKSAMSDMLPLSSLAFLFEPLDLPPRPPANTIWRCIKTKIKSQTFIMKKNSKIMSDRFERWIEKNQNTRNSPNKGTKLRHRSRTHTSKARTSTARPVEIENAGNGMTRQPKLTQR